MYIGKGWNILNRKIILENHTGIEFPENTFAELLAMVCREEKIDRSIEVNLMLTDDGYIKTLNRKYLGNDKRTDVLSFAADLPFVPLLGDIIIDTEVAAEQKGDNTLKEEVLYLFLHGLLHLLGYDHLSAAMEKIMFQKQKSYWDLYLKGI